MCVFFFQAEDGIRDRNVTGVQTCALPISQRVDDVRRQLIERIEGVEEQLTRLHTEEGTTGWDVDRVEKQATEQYIAQQERLETVRGQIEAQLGEMRQVSDQRMERYMNRFTGVDERLRAMEQTLSEIPSRF